MLNQGQAAMESSSDTNDASCDVISDANDANSDSSAARSDTSGARSGRDSARAAALHRVLIIDLNAQIVLPPPIFLEQFC